jgi:ribosome-binding factor A
VTDEIKKGMAGSSSRHSRKSASGRRTSAKCFKVPKVGSIAGCMVIDGRITRAGDTQARLLRDNVVVHEGKIGSLRRFKDDVSEVKTGFECGISLEQLQRHQGGRRHRSVHHGAGCCDGLNGATCDGLDSAMAQGYRPDRVGEEIREELSAMLARGEVHDPGIGFITLTPRAGFPPTSSSPASSTPHLGDEKARKETAKALDRATPFFRRQVGGRLRLRRVPEIEFRFDESIQHQDRIEQILRDLHAEEAQRAASDDDDGE